MPHPDYRQWLSRLREFVSAIPGESRCREMMVEAPGVDEEGRRLLQPLIEVHPDLLEGVLRFHGSMWRPANSPVPACQGRSARR